jgi:hypothetical protein
MTEGKRNSLKGVTKMCLPELMILKTTAVGCLSVSFQSTEAFYVSPPEHPTFCKGHQLPASTLTARNFPEFKMKRERAHENRSICYHSIHCFPKDMWQ